MKKGDLIKAWQEETGKNHGVERSCAALQAMYDDLCHVMARELHEGGEITLTDLGKLKTVKRNARKCRNPSTGETMHIPERLKVEFRGSKEFKELLN